MAVGKENRMNKLQVELQVEACTAAGCEYEYLRYEAMSSSGPDIRNGPVRLARGVQLQLQHRQHTVLNRHVAPITVDHTH